MNKKVFVPLIILLILPSLVSATDYYVDNARSTNGDGLMWSSAWNSLSAIEWGSLGGGDTIYISGGGSSKTYSETLNVGASGSSTSNMLRIDVGANAPDPSGHSGQVIIDGSSTRDHAIDITDENYVQVYGSYGSTYKLLLQNHDYRTIEVRDSNYVYIDYVKINNADSRGVFLQNAQYSRVRGCDIRTGIVTGSRQADGIYMQYGNDNIIEDNTIILGLNTPSAHIDAFQSANQESRLIVRGNWFEWVAGRGNEHSHAFIIEDVDDWTYVYNNVIIGSTSGKYVPGAYFKDTWPDSDGVYYIWNNILVGSKTGIGATYPVLHLGSCTNAEIGAIKNNIIVSYDGYPIYSSDEYAAGKVDNNLLYRELGGDVSRITTGRTWAEHQAAGYDVHGINVNPEYDPNNEYRPLPGAPTIDAGTTASLFNTAIDGVSRPQGSDWDIGPYEFQGAISCLGDSDCGYLNDPPCVEYVCISEVCTPTYPSVSCDDGNECTDPDICDGTGICSGTKLTGTSCQDNGVFCDGEETCDDGSCISSGNPCSDGDSYACTSIQCDDVADGCGSIIYDHSVCDDGITCTIDECTGSGANGCSQTLDDALCPDDPDCTSATCTLTGCVYEPPECQTPTDGLVLWLPLDGDAEDASGNDNDGTVNGATLVDDMDGNPGNAYMFDGNDDYIEILDSAELDGMDDLTVCLWVNITSKSDWDYILSKSIDTFATSSYGIGMDNSPDQLIGFSIRTPSGTAIAKTDNSLSLNQWYHVCGIYDGSEVSIWVNGIKQTDNDTNSGSIFDTSLPVRIGTAETNLFNGVIDDVRIYSTALTQQEIQAIYQDQQQTYHRADNNPSDCVIDTAEVMAFMQRWRVSIADVGMVEMMDAIAKWKLGNSCS